MKIRNEAGETVIEQKGSDAVRLGPGQSVEIGGKARLGEVEGEPGARAWDQDREQVDPALTPEEAVRQREEAEPAGK